MERKSNQSDPKQARKSAAREKKLRERFQQGKPTLAELIQSGDYTPPIAQGDYLELMALAAQFRETRQALSLSLADLASRCGIDKASLSRIENGQIENPTIQTLERIAHSLGKRIRFVLDDLPVRPD